MKLKIEITQMTLTVSKIVAVFVVVQWREKKLFKFVVLNN